MEYRNNFWRTLLRHFISLPSIWLLLPFILILDIVSELYHHICFPIYGIKKVKRSEYIQILDRNKLKYLYWYEKIGCMYCGYANGVLSYLKEIAGRTEKYWCGIMHENRKGALPQQHQIDQSFAKFDDEQDFLRKYPKDKIRKQKPTR